MRKEYVDRLMGFAKELKNEGLNVYVHKELTEQEEKPFLYYRHWFFVSNGKNILSISFDDFGYWTCSFQYVPHKENGTACELLARNTSELTTDKVKNLLAINNVEHLCSYNQCIKRDYITFYADEKAWFNKLWKKEQYELL